VGVNFEEATFLVLKHILIRRDLNDSHNINPMLRTSDMSGGITAPVRPII